VGQRSSCRQEWLATPLGDQLTKFIYQYLAENGLRPSTTLPIAALVTCCLLVPVATVGATGHTRTQPAIAASSAADTQPDGDAFLDVDLKSVTESGVRPLHAYVPGGHGTSAPLGRVLHSILPAGFTVDFGDVPQSRLVTWSGGKPWDVVLASLIAPLADVTANIDWTAHHVMFAHVDIPPEKASATAAASSAATPQVPAPASNASGTAAAAPASDAAVIVTPVAPSFDLVAGASVQSQLQGWAERAGWSVTWNTSDDWIVPHANSYGTDFEEAITKVISQMQANGADIRGDVWRGNHTVVVDKAGVN
jgi:Toxin co-regulated pilus biosynthesis protein Q